MKKSLLNVVIIAKGNTTLNTLEGIKSIISQNYKPIDILVVDANEPNSPHSLGLLEDLEPFENIGFMNVDHSLPLSQIRNMILDRVEGEYIAFLGTNETWEFSSAFIHIEEMEKHPDALASCSNGTIEDRRKGRWQKKMFIDNLSFEPQDWILDNPAKLGGQVIYRLDSLKKIGDFDSSFMGFCDGDMLIRLSKVGRVLIIPLPLTGYRISADNKDYGLREFKDNKRVFFKYRHAFIGNKGMTLRFYRRMIRLSKANYLWLDFLLYVFLYTLKAPFKSLFSIFKVIGLSLYHWYRILRMESHILLDKFNLMGRLLKKTSEEPVLDSGIPIIEHKLGRKRKKKAKGEAPSYLKREFSGPDHFNSLTRGGLSFDTRLRELVIPEYVRVIKRGMFYNCKYLQRVEIPETVEKIEAHAFKGCTNLRELIFKGRSNLSEIGAFAFKDCQNLNNLQFPAGLNILGTGAFMGCRSLSQINFSYYHRGKKRSSLVFPPYIEKLPPYIFAGCSKLNTVEFDRNSFLTRIEKGAFLGCKGLDTCVFPGATEALGDFAFAFCGGLRNVAFPNVDTMKVMGSHAFMGCYLLSHFQISTNMEQIGIRTFYGCKSLRMMKVPKGILSIGHQAFAGCDDLEEVLILNGDITIAQRAFDKHTRISIQKEVDESGFKKAVKELV